MNLPLSFFFNLIAEIEPSASMRDENTQPLKVQWIATAPESSTGRKGFLYFIDDEVTLTLVEDRSFGCVVRKSSASSYAGIPRIVVPDECDIRSLFDYLIPKVDAYRTWEESLHESLMGDISLQNMLDITYKLIPRPMYIADSCWRMIARIDAEMDEMSGIWHHQLQHGGYLPMETIKALIDTGEYDLITNSNRAFNVKTNAFVIGFIAKTIKFAGKLLGYFFIVDLWHDLTPYHVEVAERFGNMLGSALGSRMGSTQQIESFHENVISALLDQDHIEEQMVSNLLATTIGWRITGDYRLIILHRFPKERDNSMARMKAVGTITSGYNCYTEPYNGRIIILFSNSELEPIAFKKHLEICASKLRLPIFVSGRFSSFLDFPDEFEKTCRLADRAEFSPSGEGAVVNSDQYFPNYLAEACADRLARSYETELICKHDAKHGTEYAKSLYMFLLHERNYVTASQALFVHKNTLRNRIEKILELTNTDLNDPNVRLRLLVTLNTVLNAK